MKSIYVYISRAHDSRIPHLKWLIFFHFCSSRLIQSRAHTCMQFKKKKKKNHLIINRTRLAMHEFMSFITFNIVYYTLHITQFVHCSHSNYTHTQAQKRSRTHIHSIHPFSFLPQNTEYTSQFLHHISISMCTSFHSVIELIIIWIF